MAENFPNLGGEKRYPDPESPECSKQNGSKRPTQRHIIIKLSKVKGGNRKSNKRNTMCYIQANPIKLSADI